MWSCQGLSRAKMGESGLRRQTEYLAQMYIKGLVCGRLSHLDNPFHHSGVLVALDFGYCCSPAI